LRRVRNSVTASSREKGVGLLDDLYSVIELATREADKPVATERSRQQIVCQEPSPEF